MCSSVCSGLSGIVQLLHHRLFFSLALRCVCCFCDLSCTRKDGQHPKRTSRDFQRWTRRVIATLCGERGDGTNHRGAPARETINKTSGKEGGEVEEKLMSDDKRVSESSVSCAEQQSSPSPSSSSSSSLDLLPVASRDRPRARQEFLFRQFDRNEPLAELVG